MPIAQSAAHERLFAGLSTTVRSLALRGELRSYPRHAVLLHEGEAGDSTFVLLHGRVKVYSTDLDGREITYDVLEPGDYFGEMWLDGGPRYASAATLEPCVCSVVGRLALRDYLANSPEFVLDLVGRVIRRARKATLQARELALKDVYGRVVGALESHHGPGSPAQPVLLELTHQTLASRIGASREMVSRLLKDLERGGYVALGLRRITLLRKLPARW